MNYSLIEASDSPLHKLVITMISIIFRCGFAITCLISLSACLPEDSFLAIRFSPNGDLLAIVSEKQGLTVADPTGMDRRVVASGGIDPDSVAWIPNSAGLAYSGDREGSLDIYLSSLDGATTRVTALPSRKKSHDQWQQPALHYYGIRYGRINIIHAGQQQFDQSFIAAIRVWIGQSHVIAPRPVCCRLWV
jgi:hypothetical protein